MFLVLNVCLICLFVGFGRLGKYSAKILFSITIIIMLYYANKHKYSWQKQDFKVLILNI